MHKLTLLLTLIILSSCASIKLEKEILKNPQLTQEIILKNIDHFPKLSEAKSGPIDTKEAQALIKKKVAEYTKKSAINKKKLKKNNQFPLNRSLKSFSNNKMINLAKLEKKPMLIEFWASWCLPCIAKMETVQNIHKKYNGKITVLGINVREKSKKNARKVLKKNKIQFLNIEDSKDSYVKEFGSIPLPTTVLLDKNGKIVKVNVGFNEKVDEEKELTKEINKLL